MNALAPRDRGLDEPPSMRPSASISRSGAAMRAERYANGRGAYAPKSSSFPRDLFGHGAIGQDARLGADLRRRSTIAGPKLTIAGGR